MDFSNPIQSIPCQEYNGLKSIQSNPPHSMFHAMPEKMAKQNSQFCGKIISLHPKATDQTMHFTIIL